MNYQLNISGNSDQENRALREVETVLAEIAKKHNCDIAINKEESSAAYGKGSISRLDSTQPSVNKEGGLLSFGGELEL